MLIPLSTDVRMRQLPIANGVIIALAVVAYLAIGPAFEQGDHPFLLTRWSWTGLIGHTWMHADVWHLAGNMVFLWVFGNAVCSRIGNLWYPLVYLALGILAGLIAMPQEGHRIAGASAAINGVVGMFIVLFPLSRIKMLYTVWYAYGNVAPVPALFMVALWFVFDLRGLVAGPTGIGHGAHVAGLLVGAGVAAIALRAGWVKVYKGERTLLHLARIMRPDERVEAEPQELAPLPPAQAERLYHLPPLLSSPPQDEPPPEDPEPESVPGPPAPPRRSHFTPWRPTGDAVRARCLCGTNVLCAARQAGRVVHCPACGREVVVPQPHDRPGRPPGG